MSECARLGVKVQAFDCIYWFIDRKDWYSLSITCKVFNYLFNRFIVKIQNDVSMGKEVNGSIKIIIDSNDNNNNNNYPLIPDINNFEYITENIHWRFASSFLSSCDCNNNNDGDCCNNNADCKCCIKYGYHYTFNGKLNKSVSEILRIIECNKYCKCNPIHCKNRVSQQQSLCFSSYLKYNRNTKWGLFTNIDIFCDQFVVEFIGEILNEIEIKNRKNKNYMLTINEIINDNDNDNDKNKIISSITIDPKYYGNISRFINHSCDPNLMPILIYSQTDIPRICLFAIKNIKCHEQLTFNYGNIHENTNIPSNRRCFCGSINCQIYLPHSIIN